MGFRASIAARPSKAVEGSKCGIDTESAVPLLMLLLLVDVIGALSCELAGCSAIRSAAAAEEEEEEEAVQQLSCTLGCAAVGGEASGLGRPSWPHAASPHMKTCP